MHRSDCITNNLLGDNSSIDIRSITVHLWYVNTSFGMSPYMHRSDFITNNLIGDNSSINKGSIIVHLWYANTYYYGLVSTGCTELLFVG